MFRKTQGKVKLLLFVLLVLAIGFTRLYNLPKTTRYHHDDSRNLRDMHRIYVTRDLTLIGPISGDKSIIYPSLSFYMLLPFAAIGNFEPTAPPFGAAFYGLLTALLLIYLVRRVNKSFVIPISVLAIVWFPLIDSSRIPWNPHLVPFIQVLAIMAFLKEGKIFKFISGILFGLTFHLHYFSIVGTLIFFALVGLSFLKEKRLKEPVIIGLGFFLTIIPFIVFDLLKPPGLFFGKFLQSNLIRSGFAWEARSFYLSFWNNVQNVLLLLGGNVLFAIILGSIFLYTIWLDIKKKRSSFMFLIPVVGQIAAISFLPEYFDRYFYLTLIFFVVWFVSKRSKKEYVLVVISFVIMFVASINPLKDYLERPTREPSTYTAKEVVNYVSNKTGEDDLKNINIAVLASPDRDPLGGIYRDTLLIKNIDLLLENQFDITDNLFVVSTSEETVVREDPANVMNGFRSGALVDTFNVETTDWRVYLFNRD